jgi:hypothetical protein
MAFIKVPVITIKNLIILLFLVIISFAVGLLGKLITNKPFVSTAQAQSCWTPPPGGGGCESGGAGSAGSASCGGGCAGSCESSGSDCGSGGGSECGCF